MNFDLSSEQRKRYDHIAEQVRLHLHRDDDGRSRRPFSRAEWRRAAELGLTGLCLPSDLGGEGFGALDTALGLEAFARGGAETGLVFGVAAHLLACAVPIRDFAGNQLHGELLSGLSTGRLIAANAMTEDQAGSDVGTLHTTARRDGNHYVLTGEKSFASNAPVADIIVTYAVTDPRAGFLGISAFAVPADAPGVTLGPRFEKMGLTGCPAGRVHFDEVRVESACLLGWEGQGAAIFQHSMAWERACLLAAYVGLMDRQLDQCVAHARSRRQFGRRLAEFQAVSHRIATMKQRLEAARLLLYRACWLLDEHRNHVEAAALAKVAVSEAAVANSLDAVYVFGGAGYLSTGGVEQDLRDSVPTAIFSGTTDIQRELIARELGL